MSKKIYKLKLQTSSLTQNQANRMLELNSNFDSIHKKYDYQIRDSWFRQKHNLNVYNAQFLSRYGFIVDQVKEREYEVLDAIQKRGQEIGNFSCEIRRNFELNLDDLQEIKILSVLKVSDLACQVPSIMRVWISKQFIL